MTFILAVLLIAILALNVRASLLIWRDQLSEPKQCLMQAAIVWLFPLMGAFIVFGVHRAEEKPGGQYPIEPDTKIDPAHFVEHDS
jgi:hypothetical protein